VRKFNNSVKLDDVTYFTFSFRKCPLPSHSYGSPPFSCSAGGHLPHYLAPIALPLH